MLTGNKDVDFEILNRLTDYELTRVCKVNTKVRAYCNNEEYWKLRTYQRFSHYIFPLNPKDFVTDSWKNYYINIGKTIKNFNKGQILISGGSIYKVKSSGFLPSIPSPYEVGNDVKNILIKLDKKRKEYKIAIDKEDLKKVDELVNDQLIDVNYFIPNMDANHTAVLIFLYRLNEPNINKNLIKEKLEEISKTVVRAYNTRQVDDVYLGKLSTSYPEIGKLVQENLHQTGPPPLPGF